MKYEITNTAVFLLTFNEDMLLRIFLLALKKISKVRTFVLSISGSSRPKD